MLRIEIKTIPHKKQRYETCGDYWENEKGDIHIRVSEMRNPRYEFLVALHEMVEQFLTRERGIKEADITEFDINFEKQREMGIHKAEDEPGDDVEAPYRREHFVATNIERILANELGIDWKSYCAFSAHES